MNLAALTFNGLALCFVGLSICGATNQPAPPVARLVAALCLVVALICAVAGAPEP